MPKEPIYVLQGVQLQQTVNQSHNEKNTKKKMSIYCTYENTEQLESTHTVGGKATTL